MTIKTEKTYWKIVIPLLVLLAICLFIVGCGDAKYKYDNAEINDNTKLNPTTTLIQETPTTINTTTTEKSTEEITEEITRDIVKRRNYMYDIQEINRELIVLKFANNIDCDLIRNPVFPVTEQDAIDCAQSYINVAELGMSYVYLSIEIGNYVECSSSFFNVINQSKNFFLDTIYYYTSFINFVDNGNNMHDYSFDEEPPPPQYDEEIIDLCFIKLELETNNS